MSNLSEDAKQALLQLASKLAYIDDQGRSYYDGLFDALYPLSSISAVYTPVGSVHADDSLDSLKLDLVVTASYSDGTSGIIPSADYTLSGTLTVGTSTITVTYRSKTTTLTVTVLPSVDYTLDATSGVTWTTGYGYDTSTGALGAASNTYCTEKFAVQDCVYEVSDANADDSYLRVHLWDANDNYMGYSGVNGSSMDGLCLTSSCKCALQYTNSSSTFDSSKVSMMPLDNRSTAVAPFEIDLIDYVDDITETAAFGVYFYTIPKTSFDIEEKGVTGHTYADRVKQINRVSCICTVAGNNFAAFTYTHAFRAGVYYNSATGIRANVVQLGGPNITTLADMKQYITDNRPVIRFN